MTNLDAPPLIDLNGEKKAFTTDAGLFLALKGVDLHVDAGEYVAIIGKSGSGKTTLNNMITGLDRLTEDEILVGGENRLAIWRGRTIGVVFQLFQLIPNLTALENVMLPMDFCSTPAFTERRDRARELLRLMEIEDQANNLPLVRRHPPKTNTFLPPTCRLRSFTKLIPVYQIYTARRYFA